MDKPNFYRAKLKAYETLIKQKSFSFPIEPRKLKLDSYNIIVRSLQEYSREHREGFFPVLLSDRPVVY